jgi:hypothetical protein
MPMRLWNNRSIPSTINAQQWHSTSNQEAKSSTEALYARLTVGGTTRRGRQSVLDE